jgi:hypothetical protein
VTEGALVIVPEHRKMPHQQFITITARQSRKRRPLQADVIELGKHVCQTDQYLRRYIQTRKQCASPIKSHVTVIHFQVLSGVESAIPAGCKNPPKQSRSQSSMCPAKPRQPMSLRPMMPVETGDAPFSLGDSHHGAVRPCRWLPFAAPPR